ncbi:MAG: polymerase III subunit beta protein, partial [Parcubacteria group bacterium GW2011_GWA2_51_10]
MRLTTTKEKILQAVTVAERITGKKESLPILSCILFDASEHLAARATNLEAGIEIIIPADIEERGAVAVPAGILSQTLRALQSEKLTLKTDGGNLLIESRGTKTLIKAIPHEEFPKLSLTREKKSVVVARELFLGGLQAVSYAASLSMIRPELGSIYVSVKSADIVFAATDSFRLAEKKVKGIGSEDYGEILIPLKHAVELSHILEHIPEETIELSAAESELKISTGAVRYVSRVIDGSFPNYQEIIPRTFVIEATLLKNDFAEALRKARVFSGSDMHVGLHLYPARKIFSMTAQSA